MCPIYSREYVVLPPLTHGEPVILVTRIEESFNAEPQKENCDFSHFCLITAALLNWPNFACHFCPVFNNKNSLESSERMIDLALTGESFFPRMIMEGRKKVESFLVLE